MLLVTSTCPSVLYSYWVLGTEYSYCGALGTDAGYQWLGTLMYSLLGTEYSYCREFVFITG